MSVGTNASQAFSPNKLLSLQLWLDASDIGTIEDIGGQVSQWDDKSVNGRDAVQGTLANQPTTGTRIVGIHNVVDFDGINDLMVLNDQPVTGTAARTIVVVALADDPAGQNYTLSLSDTLGVTGGSYLVTTEIGLRINGANRLFPDDAVEDGISAAIIILTNEVDSALFNNDSNFQVYKNGLLLTGGTEANQETSFDTQGGSASIGDRADETANSLDGIIAELIVYDRVLLEAERQTVEAYLTAKWRRIPPDQIDGLQLWLDASDTNMITESGGLVSEWRDKSGNSNDATQSDNALKPVTDANTIAGRNVITYDGADDVLSILANSSIDNIFSGGGSVFAVLNPLTAGQNNLGVIFAKNDLTVSQLENVSGGEMRIAFTQEFGTSGGNFSSTNRDISLGDDHIVAILYDSSNVINLPEFRVNGLLVSIDVNEAPVGVPMDDSAGDLIIGNRLGGEDTWGGHFAEIIMFDHILTEDETTGLENYLSNKWQIPLA